MKITRIITGIAAIIIGLGAAWLGWFGVNLALQSRNAEPVLLSVPEQAVERGVAMMEAFRVGDFAGAGAYLYGQPALSADMSGAGESETMIWDAFVESISYEFTGEVYASDSGVARDVTVRTLRIPSVTEHLRDRSQKLLNDRVAAAEDVSEVYDADNNYREDFVMEVLHDATIQALQEDAEYQTVNLTLYMVYEAEQWWVLPNPELLSAVSGQISI